MTYSRHILLDYRPEIIISCRRIGIDTAFQLFTPTLDTWCCMVPIISIGNIRPASRRCINPTVVFLFPISYQVRQILFLVGSRRFVPIIHQAERRMVAIFFQDTVTFFIEPFVQIFPVTDICPATTFNLQIDTHTIGYPKSRFRRAPGMKTYMI